MRRTFNLCKSPTNLFYFNDDNFNEIALDIPEERLNSGDFEKGLTHELTEITLRQIIFPITKRTDRCSLLLHEITVLSLGRYETIKKQYDRLKATFWNNGE